MARSPYSGSAFLGVLLLSAGCANPPTASSVTSPEPSGTAYEQLVFQIAAETPSSGVLHAVPLPPGLDMAKLQATSGDPQPDLASLAEQLESRADALLSDHETVAAPAQVSEEDARESLSRYLKGTDDAIAGHHRSAIVHLDEASRLSPDQPETWRRLAESWAALGNADTARQMYEQALRLDPQHTGTRLALAWSDAGARNTAGVLDRLAPSWPFDTSFADDPVGRRHAYLLTCRAVRELGWDRAFLEAGQAAIALPLPQPDSQRDRRRMTLLRRQEADLLLALGDTSVRRGEFDAATEAWARIIAMPPFPRSTAVARLAWLHQSRGAEALAQLVVLDALTGRTRTADARMTALCVWLLQRTAEPALFRQALLDILDRESDGADTAAPLRLRAMIDPSPSTLSRLEAALLSAPDDMMSSHVLLAARAVHPQQAIATAARLAEQMPHRTEALVDQLRLTLADPLAAASSPAAEPGAESMRIRLLLEGWQLGPAWSALESARQRWPDDPRLARLAVDVTAELDEPALFDRAVAECAALDDGWTQVVLSKGFSRLGRFEEAAAAAARAEQHVESRVAGGLARAENIARAGAAGPPEHHAAQRAEVIAIARELVTLAPEHDAPWVMLTTAALSGQRPDAALLQETIRGLQKKRLSGALLPTVLAGVEARRGNLSATIRYASRAHLAEPASISPISQMTTAWESLGQTDRAIEFLRQEINDHPNDPVLHDQLIRLLLRSDHIDAARAMVSRRTVVRSDDPLGSILAELVAAAVGDVSAKADLAQARLLTRPPGTRRAIEYASALVHGGREEEARQTLRWMTDHLDAGRRDHFLSALGIFSGMTDVVQADPVLAALVDAGTVQFDDLPLPVYAIGLRALARSGAADTAAFDTLARRAAERARGAENTTLQGAIPWSQLAQRLVDDGHPGAAARAVRNRLTTPRIFAPEANTVLTTMVIACQAASGPAGAEETLVLLRELDGLGRLDAMILSDGVVELNDVLDWASRIYSIQGDVAGANRLLVEAVAVGADDPMILNNLGYLRLEMGEGSPQVVAWIEAAGDALPENASVVDTVGWLRYKQGRFADGETPGALTLLEKALRLSGEPTLEGLLHRGDALWRVGRHDEARRDWNEVIRRLRIPKHRSEQQDLYRRMQAGTWGVTVIPPAEMYDHEFGAMMAEARRRTEAVDRGEAPPVAPTFAELESAASGTTPARDD